jgi:hypothetical protein
MPVLRIQIQDPGSGIWCLFDLWIWDPGSGTNNPDIISESLKTIFWVKILKFVKADPASGMEKFGSRMEKIWIQDPG